MDHGHLLHAQVASYVHVGIVTGKPIRHRRLAQGRIEATGRGRPCCARAKRSEHARRSNPKDHHRSRSRAQATWARSPPLLACTHMGVKRRRHLATCMGSDRTITDGLDVPALRAHLQPRHRKPGRLRQRRSDHQRRAPGTRTWTSSCPPRRKTSSRAKTPRTSRQAHHHRRRQRSGDRRRRTSILDQTRASS